MPLALEIGDIITTKKPHPCGSKRWEILRVGADIKIRCIGCGHMVMTPRSKIEKNIKNIEKPLES